MSNETSVKSRQSGIELLKIFAMFGIVFFHCLLESKMENSPFLQYMDFSKPTKDLSVFTIQMLYYLGTLGNMIFLISSAWFLVESNNIKLSKIMYIILDVYIFSIMFLLIFRGINLPFGSILKSLFPTTFSNNWYITCYLLLYAIFPLLNTIIEKMTQKQHLAYNVMFFILYFLINSIKANLFYMNRLVVFIGVYFFVAYVKKYQLNFISNKKNNIICLIIGIILLFLLQLFVNIIGLRVDVIGSRVLHFASTDNHNPIILLIAYCFFAV